MVAPFSALRPGERRSTRCDPQAVEANIAAFMLLAKFSPYVAGDTFTQADCAAFNNLPLVGMASKASKAIYGDDLLIAVGVDYKPYIRRIGERPSAQKMVADRKAAQAKL